MARFNMEESKNYQKKASNFFSLKEDKETARVRFLINDINDLYGVSVHEVEENGNKYDVECIRNYDEPVNKCPLCAAGYQVKSKLFIPIYNEETQLPQVWSRGLTYFDTISGLCSRYGNPLVGQPFDIERQGKKGDPTTKYGIFPMGAPDHSRVEDFPELKLEETAFKVRTAEEMQNFLDTGSFEQSQTRQQPRGTSNQTSRQVPIRRTPARGEEDAF